MSKRIKRITITEKYIYDERLNSTETIIIGAIVSLSQANGYCNATNKYLSEIAKCNERNISYVLKKLVECNLIRIETTDDYKRKIFPIGMQSIAGGYAISSTDTPAIDCSINNNIYKNKYKDNINNLEDENTPHWFNNPITEITPITKEKDLEFIREFNKEFN